jgi:hypothetical protein
VWLEPELDVVEDEVMLLLGILVVVVVVVELPLVTVCDPVEDVVIPLLGFVVLFESVDDEDVLVVSPWLTVVPVPVEVVFCPAVTVVDVLSLVEVADSDIVDGSDSEVVSKVVCNLVVGSSVVVIRESHNWSSYQLGLRS